MKECLFIIESGLTSLDMVKQKIESLKDDVQHTYKRSLFNNRASEVQYHMMAIDQALDIVNKLEARYITGQYDSCPRIYKGREIVIYEDEQL